MLHIPGEWRGVIVARAWGMSSSKGTGGEVGKAVRLSQSDATKSFSGPPRLSVIGQLSR